MTYFINFDPMTGVSINKKHRFVVEYLAQNRDGGLEDREVVVMAVDEAEAMAIVQVRYPSAAVGYAEQVAA